MKLKIKRKNGEWFTAMNRGNGGVSSLVVSRMGKSLLYVLGIFLSFHNWRLLLLPNATKQKR